MRLAILHARRIAGRQVFRLYRKRECADLRGIGPRALVRWLWRVESRGFLSLARNR
jgi:hypothetical protein